MTVIPGEEQAVVGGGTVSAQTAAANPYDSAYRHNPGTKIVLTRDKRYTAPGILTQPFVFPAPPLDQLERDLTYNWGDYDTISAGQFSRPSSMQLQTIQFDTIIVSDDYPWVFYNPLRQRGWTPEDTVKELGRTLRSGSPFWFDVYNVEFKPDTSGGSSEVGARAGVNYDFGPAPILHMRATLRTLTSASKSGEPDALYITVGFTEHRIPGATEQKLGKGSSARGGADSRNTPATIPLSVFQGSGAPPQNTLQELAIAYYGSAARWRDLLTANKWLGSITATHDLGDLNTAELKAALKAGRKLAIPQLSS